MLYRLFTVLALLPAALAQAAHAADLTPLEMRWLQGVAPVVTQARTALVLPLDVVVQPQDAPGAPPLALAFIDGRCKLVLSMRGNHCDADQRAGCERQEFREHEALARPLRLLRGARRVNRSIGVAQRAVLALRG